jgi:hypothetical protein
MHPIALGQLRISTVVEAGVYPGVVDTWRFVVPDGGLTLRA